MNPNDAADAAAGEILENAIASSRCRTFRLVSLLCGALGFLNGRGVAAVGDAWEWRNPLPQGSGLNAMAESQGRLIAVGRAGTILTTTDGLNWTARVSGTRNHLRTVAAAGATVVGVGREGDITASTDGGLTWHVRAVSSAEWTTLVHGNGTWVAAGGTTVNGDPSGVPEAAVMTSPDGLTWTARAVPDSAGVKCECSVWTGSRFVLGGWGIQGPNGLLAVSEDGVNWTRRTANFHVNALAWSGSNAVAAGVPAQIVTSSDTSDWTAIAAPGTESITGLFWTGSQFLAWDGGGTGVIYSSPTGDEWRPHTLDADPHFIGNAAASAGTTLVMAGESGHILHSPDGGGTWSARLSGVAEDLNAVIRFGGRWVAAGADGSLTSSADGAVWTPSSSGTRSNLKTMAWHGGLWVAGGDETVIPPGLVAGRRYSLFTSTDGITWVDRSFGNAETNGIQPIRHLMHAGAQWVATVDDAVLTSPDGTTWEEHSVGSNNRAAAWNGSRLIVVDGLENVEGRVHLSDDGGATWSYQSLGVDVFLGATWSENQFIIVGEKGQFFSSPSGLERTWFQHSTGTTAAIQSVIADQRGFFALGRDSRILISPGGSTWTWRSTPTTQRLLSLGKAGSLYVATGYDGVVLTSPDAISWRLNDSPTTHELFASASDGEQLLVCGESGAILATVPEMIHTFRVDVNDSVRAVALKSDESILIGGSFTAVSGATRNGIANFDQLGRLTMFDPGIDGEVRCIATQADGKVLAGGEFNMVGGIPRRNFVRISQDGAPEADFRVDTDEVVRCIALEPDDDILMGGGFTMVNGEARPGIARLYRDGALDLTFNPSPNGSVLCMAIQEDGRILLGGAFTRIDGVERNYLARLHPDGRLDAGFNPNAGLSVHCLAIQADGRILAGGDFTTIAGVAQNRLARLNPDGSLDQTFFSLIGGGTVLSLAVQANGEILTGGTFTSVNGRLRRCLARLIHDGSVAPLELGMNSHGGADTAVTSIALPENGGLLTGGTFNTINGLAYHNFASLGNDPATASLSNAGSGAIRWLRGGSSPEVSHVTFEVKPSGATEWIPLGDGRRIAGGWELTGLSLPPAGGIRARGRAGGSLYESVEPIPVSLDDWRRLYFGSPLNEGSGADTADPDFDMIPNLVEYALGSDPHQNSPARLPNGEVTGSEFVLNVMQAGDASGITLGAEWTTTLEMGSWSPISDSAIGLRHTFRVPMSRGPRLFVRLKVTSP